MAKVFLNTRRDGYGTDQCGETMTVGELIAYLGEFDEDAKVFLKNNNGYTYGRITMNSFEDDFDEEEEEEEDDE